MVMALYIKSGGLKALTKWKVHIKDKVQYMLLDGERSSIGEKDISIFGFSQTLKNYLRISVKHLGCDTLLQFFLSQILAEYYL